MDGVIYKGDQVLPGASELLSYFDNHNHPYLFVTNNSTRTPLQVAGHLERMGIAVNPDRILTSSIGVALYLKKSTPRGGRVFVLGEEGLRTPLGEAGFTVVDDGPADFVVVGMDRTVTYDKLRRATFLIRDGAAFIGTNPDPTYPTPEGLVPGAGAFLAALKATTSVNPRIIGKPEPTCFQLALEIMGVDKDRTAAIGDRLDTDIEGGRRAGLRTILVMTGVTTPADLDASSVRPDWVFADLSELLRAIDSGSARRVDS